MKKDLTFYFKCISKHIEQKAIAYVNDNGLTLKQGRAIDFLNSRPNKSASQKEIGRFFKVSHPTVTGIVQRMEKQGLVSVDPSRKGRASKMLTLTEKGIAICRRGEELVADFDETMLKGFTEEEAAALVSMLARVCENLCPEDVVAFAAEDCEEEGEGVAESEAKEA